MSLFTVHANNKFKYTWKPFHCYLLCISRSRNTIVIETLRNNVVIEALKKYSTPVAYNI